MEFYRQLIPDLQWIVDQYRFKRIEPLPKPVSNKHILRLTSKRRNLVEELTKIFDESHGISNYQFGSWEREQRVYKVEDIGNGAKRHYFKEFKVFVPSEYNQKWLRLSPNLRRRIAETPKHTKSKPTYRIYNRIAKKLDWY